MLKNAGYKIKYRNLYKIKPSLFESGSKIKLLNSGSICGGANIRLRANTNIVAIGGKIDLGDSVFFNRNCNVVCREKISIGDNVSFGHNVCVIDHDHRFGKEGVSPTEYKTGEIVIEKGCWIGSNAVILRNTHIGACSVIGAGCVVKGDIPPNSLVTGCRELNIKEIKNGVKNEEKVDGNNKA